MADHLTVTHCRTCGRPIAPRGDGGFVHRGGGHVAACDLDADHPAEPEPPAPGPAGGTPSDVPAAS